MKHLKAAAAIAAITLIAGLTPVLASEAVQAPPSTETVSNNGIVSLVLPDQSWVELPSASSAAFFSSGDCSIAVDIYEIGADLPTLLTTDDHHAMIYQTSTATKSYVILATGYVDEQYDFAGIRDSINSMSIAMEQITDNAVHKKAPEPEFTVEDASYAAWVTSSALNVREEPGTDGAVIGEISYGTKVEVTGTVMKDGEEFGWVRIDYDGGDGFVSEKFLTDEEIPDDPVVVDERTVYTDDGEKTKLYEYSDGTWQNADGVVFQYAVEIDVWIGDDGSSLYDYDPTEHHHDFPTVTVHDDEGEYVTIYQIESGEWVDDNGRFFDYDEEGNCWISEDGYYFWE